jgi:glycosyltransferase involved in cell wall biosynthesis
MLGGASRRRATVELHERHERAWDPGCVESMPRVSVVIPTLTEALNLPFVLPRLPEWIDELVIVDGHSTDDTVQVAEQLWPSVQVVYQDGKGKGNALACGLAACTGEIAVLLDADGSTDPGEIPSFVEAIVNGAQFAKGSRFLAGAGSDDLTLLRRVGNGVLTWLVNRLFGTRYSDLCYGFNAIRLDCVDALALDVQGFEIETLMGIRAAKAGLVVVEVPSWERARIHGRTNLRTFRDGQRVLATILRESRFICALTGGRSAAPPGDQGTLDEIAARDAAPTRARRHPAPRRTQSTARS